MERVFGVELSPKAKSLPKEAVAALVKKVVEATKPTMCTLDTYDKAPGGPVIVFYSDLLRIAYIGYVGEPKTDAIVRDWQKGVMPLSGQEKSGSRRRKRRGNP